MASHYTYRVVCNKCGHYQISDRLPQKSEYENWSCSLCSTPKGVVRFQNFTKCGTCSQVYNSKESCPNCETEPKVKEYRMGKIGDWGNEPKVNEDVTLAVEKGESILRNRVKNEIEEKAKRDKNIERLLIEQNKILKKLARKSK